VPDIASRIQSHPRARGRLDFRRRHRRCHARPMPATAKPSSPCLPMMPPSSPWSSKLRHPERAAQGWLHVSLSTISVALSDRLESAPPAPAQAIVSAPVFWAPRRGRNRKARHRRRRTLRHPWSGWQPLFEAMGPKLLVAGEKAFAGQRRQTFWKFPDRQRSGIPGPEAIAFARKSGVDPRRAPRLSYQPRCSTHRSTKSTEGSSWKGTTNPRVSALPLGLKDIDWCCKPPRRTASPCLWPA